MRFVFSDRKSVFSSTLPPAKQLVSEATILCIAGNEGRRRVEWWHNYSCAGDHNPGDHYEQQKVAFEILWPEKTAAGFLSKWCEKQTQKFHIDDVSLPGSPSCFWLVVWREKCIPKICFHQSDTLPRYRGETSGDVARCWLFFQAKDSIKTPIFLYLWIYLDFFILTSS